MVVGTVEMAIICCRKRVMTWKRKMTRAILVAVAVVAVAVVAVVVEVMITIEIDQRTMVVVKEEARAETCEGYCPYLETMLNILHVHVYPYTMVH